MSSNFSFEIKFKDIGGRVGKINIGKKEIETPAIIPVYNPNKVIVSADEFEKKFKSGILMTNSYIILKNDELRKKILDSGIHRAINFNGIVATDSGSYQLMEYGNVNTTNKEIIEFQEKIGSDIGSFLDIPSLPDAYKPRVLEQLEITLQRARDARNAKFVVNAGIQGSTYLDLRERAAKEIGKEFELCAIGGIVKLMEEYRFSDLVDIIATVKKNIPSNRVVHAFGLGHPMVFSLAVALGCDLFDSAAYALYAQDFRYMTPTGTKKLDELEYLPCSCPICNKYGTELKELENDEKIRELARHNLYITFEELNRVKQAIRENNLWDLLSVRMRSHPALLSTLKKFAEHREWLSKSDLITKKSSFYSLGEESESRTEVVNVKERVNRVNQRPLVSELRGLCPRIKSENKVEISPFGEVPAEILDIYPFGSIMTPENLNSRINTNIRDINKVKKIMEYQFGSGADSLIDEKVRIKRSRKTGRIRWIYDKKELIASVRASDHFIIPKIPLAEKIHKFFKYPKLRVVIDQEALPFVSEGKSVFAKFVREIDMDLRAGDEVLVVDENDNLIRTGTLILSPQECLDFDRGIAVRVR